MTTEEKARDYHPPDANPAAGGGRRREMKIGLIDVDGMAFQVDGFCCKDYLF